MASTDVLTPEELADACEGSLRVERRMQAQMMSGELFGATSPRYDRATIEKVLAALDHASQLLQAAMPSLPCEVVRREKQVAEAKGDGEFQAFIAATLAAPEKPRRKPAKRRAREGALPRH